MAKLQITEFTDPACPFAWSAEPVRYRLRWLYGEQLSWQLRMVGLAESPQEYEEKGFTPERQAASFRRLAHDHHMPIDSSPRPRVAATMPACRAVVAVRRHLPDHERAMLRVLRILHFSGWPLDEAQTTVAGAQRVGIDAERLEQWIAEPETEELLRRDLELSRHPDPSALALSHKLAAHAGGHDCTLSGALVACEPQAGAVGKLLVLAPVVEDVREIGGVLDHVGGKRAGDLSYRRPSCENPSKSSTTGRFSGCRPAGPSFSVEGLDGDDASATMQALPGVFLAGEAGGA